MKEGLGPSILSSGTKKKVKDFFFFFCTLFRPRFESSQVQLASLGQDKGAGTDRCLVCKETLGMSSRVKMEEKESGLMFV